ncbi:SGNH/GDSL hydrolase family protein [bacterium]|nr:SGNH/GDSL hydrolase family protein [bacterium]
MAERVLALEPLHPEDVVPLGAFSILLFGVSALVTFRDFRMRKNTAATILALLVLVGVEAAARTYVRTLAIEDRAEIILLARRTYRDQMAYQPHPFLQFTGRPGITFQGQAFGTLLPFNKLGFNSPDLPEKKPPNTIRVACLGGSTTADGYPHQLERFLRRRAGQDYSFQAMNFGLGWYTSTHSVVNFVLNALDYSPDYVVFLHAINEGRGRGRVGGVRGDYTHLCKPFEYPRIKDAYLVRASVIYRYLKQVIRGTPDWAFLDSAVVRHGKQREGDPYADLLDLKLYERNTRTIVDLALVRGITPVLTTQPHSTDPVTHVDY